MTFSHAGVPVRAHPGLNDTGQAAAATALLFICASLALYLGAEVRGGSRTVRRGLLVAVVVVGATFAAAAIPLGRVPNDLRDAAVPAAAIAQAYSGRGLAVTVGLLTAASTLALIVAEYLALARLLHWLHGAPIRSLLRWIAVPFIAADAISLVNPERFYNDLLKVSLGRAVRLAARRVRRLPELPTRRHGHRCRCGRFCPHGLGSLHTARRRRFQLSVESITLSSLVRR